MIQDAIVFGFVPMGFISIGALIWVQEQAYRTVNRRLDDIRRMYDRDDYVDTVPHNT